MKQASRIWGWLGIGCIIAAVFAGCSRKSGARVDIQAQIAALQSSDTNAVEDACIALAKAGERAAPAVSDLIPLLKSKDEEVRRLAAYALGEIGPKAKAAFPVLQEMLTTEMSRRVQAQIGMSLGNIDASNAPPVIPNIQ